MILPSLLVALSGGRGLIGLQLRAWTRPFSGRAFGEHRRPTALTAPLISSSLVHPQEQPGPVHTCARLMLLQSLLVVSALWSGSHAGPTAPLDEHRPRSRNMIGIWVRVRGAKDQRGWRSIFVSGVPPSASTRTDQADPSHSGVGVGRAQETNGPKSIPYASTRTDQADFP